MSIRNILRDERVTSPIGDNGTSVLYGKFFSLASNGGNQVKGRPLEAHPYTLNITDQCSALYLSWSCEPGMEYIDYSSQLPTCKLYRAWTVLDDYALYGKLEEQYDKGEFNAAVFAGELGETVDLLAGRARQLGRALMAAKKGNFAKAADVLSRGAANAKNPKPGSKKPRDTGKVQDPQRVSDGWLELQYGWLPLLSDITALADQVARLDTPRKKRIIAQRKIPYIPNVSALFEQTGGGRYSKQIIAYIEEDIPSWPQALGLENPELVAWELVPFSFVADWFLPVGAYLEARAFASRAKGTFIVTETRKWHCRTGDAKLLCVGGNVGRHKILSGISWNRSVYVKRTVSTSLPGVPLPVFQNGFTTLGHIYNAAALIAGIFGPKNISGR